MVCRKGGSGEMEKMGDKRPVTIFFQLIKNLFLYAANIRFDLFSFKKSKIQFTFENQLDRSLLLACFFDRNTAPLIYRLLLICSVSV